MEILLILLFLLLIGSLYGNINLYKKYSKLEEIAQENQDFILAIRNRVMSQRSYLKQIDKKGSFESDDEVGYFFKELKKIINDISLYFEDEEIVDDEKDNEPRSIITSRL
jgi:hypothetical protein